MSFYQGKAFIFYCQISKAVLEEWSSQWGFTKCYYGQEGLILQQVSYDVVLGLLLSAIQVNELMQWVGLV